MIGAAAILLTSGTYRFGVITTMIASIIMLSLVVLTGFVGQISLAQASLAGIAGFALSKLTTDTGVPFPLSLALSSSVAALFGVVIGIPALRIRGAQLAVVTLAGGVALEKFVFRNPAFTSSSGNPIAKPILLGLDVSIRSGRNVARWQFGFVVLAVLLAVALVVSNLAVSATGRRMLAVRSNERAAAAAGIDVAQTKLVAFGIASFIAGLGGSLIGYSRGQLSADSFTALVGLTLLAFAYLGGISSVAGALVAGMLAPLGIGYVILDRLFDMGNSYGVFAGFTLILTAILNQDGIVGAMRDTIGARRRSIPRCCGARRGRTVGRGLLCGRVARACPLAGESPTQSSLPTPPTRRRCGVRSDGGDGSLRWRRRQRRHRRACAPGRDRRADRAERGGQDHVHRRGDGLRPGVR